MWKPKIGEVLENRRAINIKFILGRSKFLEDEKATYIPRTK